MDWHSWMIARDGDPIEVVFVEPLKFWWGVGGWVTPADGQDVLTPVISLHNDSPTCPARTLSEVHYFFLQVSGFSC
jgi:hypothetical protein